MDSPLVINRGSNGTFKLTLRMPIRAVDGRHRCYDIECRLPLIPRIGESIYTNDLAFGGGKVVNVIYGPGYDVVVVILETTFISLIEYDSNEAEAVQGFEDYCCELVHSGWRLDSESVVSPEPDEEAREIPHPDQKYENIYVDIPTANLHSDSQWRNVANFTTMREAVAWIRENIGHCDDQGNICLITLGEEAQQVVAEYDTPQKVCPSCASDDIANEDGPSDGRLHITCHHCGQQWTEPDEPLQYDPEQAETEGD